MQKTAAYPKVLAGAASLLWREGDRAHLFAAVRGEV